MLARPARSTQTHASLSLARTWVPLDLVTKHESVAILAESNCITSGYERPSCQIGRIFRKRHEFLQRSSVMQGHLSKG